MALFNFKKEEKVREKKAASVSEPKAAPTSSRSVRVDATKKHESVLLAPRITEKGTLVAEGNVYVFNVLPSATKAEIAGAVRHVYGVTPRKVRVAPVPSSLVSTRGRNPGMTSGGKKAYVYLAKGDTISFA